MITNGVNFVPIPIDILSTRYQIDLQSGVIMDVETMLPVNPYLDEDRLMVSLTGSNDTKVEAAVEDLIIRSIFGDVGSSVENHVTELPCDTGLISPALLSFNRESPDCLIINDRKYRRWKDSNYFVSAYGAVFSMKQNQWLRINYDENGTGYVSTKEDGAGRTRRIPRLVWETYRAPLGTMATLIPKDGNPWNARVENLDVVTRSEKRALKHPEKYHIFDDDTTDLLRQDLLSKLSNREIAEKHGLKIDYVWKLRTGRLVPRGFEDVGEAMKDRGRDKPLSADTVRKIRSLKSEGKRAKQISEELGIGKVTIYQILQGKTYKDVE